VNLESRLERRSRLIAALLAVALAATGGCGQGYNEALQAYNNEAQILDRLNSEYEPKLAAFDRELEKLKTDLEEAQNNWNIWKDVGWKEAADIIYRTHEIDYRKASTDEDRERVKQEAQKEVDESIEQTNEVHENLMVATARAIERVAKDRKALVTEYEPKIREQQGRVDDAMALKERLRK